MEWRRPSTPQTGSWLCPSINTGSTFLELETSGWASSFVLTLTFKTSYKTMRAIFVFLSSNFLSLSLIRILEPERANIMLSTFLCVMVLMMSHMSRSSSLWVWQWLFTWPCNHLCGFISDSLEIHLLIFIDRTTHNGMLWSYSEYCSYCESATTSQLLHFTWGDIPHILAKDHIWGYQVVWTLPECVFLLWPCR